MHAGNHEPRTDRRHMHRGYHRMKIAWPRIEAIGRPDRGRAAISRDRLTVAAAGANCGRMHETAAPGLFFAWLAIGAACQPFRPPPSCHTGSGIRKGSVEPRVRGVLGIAVRSRHHAVRCSAARWAPALVEIHRMISILHRTIEPNSEQIQPGRRPDLTSESRARRVASRHADASVAVIADAFPRPLP